MLLSHFVADAIREIDVSGTAPFSLRPATIAPSMAPVVVEVVTGSGSLTFEGAADATIDANGNLTQRQSALTNLVPGSVIQLASDRITAKSGVTLVRVYYKFGG